MLRPLGIHIQHWKFQNGDHYYLGTTHHCKKGRQEACGEYIAGFRTISQNLSDLHEGKDLRRKVSLEIYHRIFVSITFET
jgi:hypothetical protein